MEKEKIDQFLLVNGKNFPEESISSIKQILTDMDDEKYNELISTQWKNPTIGFLLAFFLGGLGADRFWLGQVGLGVLKLITIGGLGLWCLIDWFLVWGNTKKYNLKKLQSS